MHLDLAGSSGLGLHNIGVKANLPSSYLSRQFQTVNKLYMNGKNFQYMVDTGPISQLLLRKFPLREYMADTLLDVLNRQEVKEDNIRN